MIGADGPTYPAGATYLALAPSPDARPRRYVDLPGAWRVAVEPVPASPGRWPWRASLANRQLANTWNRANVVLPAKSGISTVPLVFALPAGVKRLQVTLLRDGVEQDTRAIDAP